MKFRIRYLLSGVYFVLGLFISLFAFAWDVIIYHDPSQFYIAVILGVNVMIVAIMSYLFFKQAESLETHQEELKKLNEREFEFEGYVRDNVK